MWLFNLHVDVKKETKMDLEELLSVLPEEYKDTVANLVNAEKQKGISEYKKKDSEVMKYKALVKDLGYDSEQYSNVDEFKQSTKTKLDTAEKSSLTLKMLNEQLTDLKSQLTNEVNSRVEKETKFKHEKIRNVLNQEIGNKLYGSKYLIDNIISSNQLDLNDDSIVSKDGKDLNTFITNILEENKDSLRVEQTKGPDLRINPSKTELSDKSVIEQLRAQMGLK